jgi:hypothetical protein
MNQAVEMVLRALIYISVDSMKHRMDVTVHCLSNKTFSIS